MTNWRKLYIIVPLLLLSLFYFSITPLYIQGGDTAELVNASYHLFVPHPPGYPLYLWAQYIWTHLFPLSTIFWRAGVLSAILCLWSLVILGRSSKEKLFIILPFLLLGLKPEFIESAVLPDVFSLHAFLIALFAYHFLLNPSKEKNGFLSFLFFLNFSNHHTTLFLTPCYLYLWHETGLNRSEMKKIALGSLLGCSVSLCLYLSLFLCQPTHVQSWGELVSVENWIKHLIRYDYGTFKLAPNLQPRSSDAFFYMIKSVLPIISLLIVGFIISFKDKIKIFSQKRLWAWLATTFITILFPLIINVLPRLQGEEVLRRFHIMPLVVIMVFIIYLLNQLTLTKKKIVTISLFVLLITVLNLSHLHHFKGLRNDSTIEDYVTNLYQQRVQNSPSVIIADNDSVYFGLKYVQSFDTENGKNVAIISPPLLFHPWFLSKVQKQLPTFNLPEALVIQANKRMHFENDLITPNVDKIKFIVTKDYSDGKMFKVTFLPVGRMLQTGSGVYFSDKSPEDLSIKEKLQSIPVGPQHFTKGSLYYQYTHWYMAKAFESTQTEEAKSYWEKALRLVPYSYPAMANLCQASPEKYGFCEPHVLHELMVKNEAFY